MAVRSHCLGGTAALLFQSSALSSNTVRAQSIPFWGGGVGRGEVEGGAWEEEEEERGGGGWVRKTGRSMRETDGEAGG